MSDKLEHVILVCDNIILRPVTETTQKTKSGIFAPNTTNGTDKVTKGYVLKVGPGYPINVNEDFDWKGKDAQNSYIKLQAEEGDLAHYYANDAVEVFIEGEPFIVISQDSIILLERKPY